MDDEGELFGVNSKTGEGAGKERTCVKEKRGGAGTENSGNHTSGSIGS